MGTTQHTPAPWDYVIADNAEQPHCKVVDRLGYLIAELPIVQENNVQLIAAAPDMLEALEWAVETADTDQYEADWYAAARAAIAKAKGQ